MIIIRLILQQFVAKLAFCDYIYSRMTTNVLLPNIISDGRLDAYLRLINLIKSEPNREISLDWSRSVAVSPAGLAILSCIFDSLIEQKIDVRNKNIPEQFQKFAPISDLKDIAKFQDLPEPAIHNIDDTDVILRGISGTINTLFTERLYEKFSNKVSEDILYAASLIINELMQNSVDHSTAERYYVYAGLWKNEFHAGLLDMGISIPAKLEQKYVRKNDLEYLELSLEKGSSTRRQRPGGFGLYYFFEFLKENEGKLTIVSRNAQIRKYFRTRRSQKNILKHPLPGTWCFARFSLEG